VDLGKIGPISISALRLRNFTIQRIKIMKNIAASSHYGPKTLSPPPLSRLDSRIPSASQKSYGL